MSVPDQYYSPTGEELTRDKIVQWMIQNYTESESKLTDFSEGTEVRTLLESIALSVFGQQYYTNLEFRQKYLTYATGSFLDLIGDDEGLPRKEGVRASGFVTVSIAEPLSTNIIINESVSFINPVTSVTYEIYKTLEQINNNTEYQIVAGEVSVDIPVQASDVGKEGNCDRETVIDFYEAPPYDGLSVTNHEPITSGSDSETDDEYRERLFDHIRHKFGTKECYQDLVKTVNGVHDCLVVYEDKQVKCYINGNNKPVQSLILTEALELLSNENNHVLGHNFGVYEPDYNLINLKLEINANEVKEETIKQRIQYLFDGGMSEEMQFYGYNMGESLTETDILGAITSIDGVISCTPYIMNSNAEYERFNTIVCQENEVITLASLEVVFR